jgi:hypothetical protein
VLTDWYLCSVTHYQTDSNTYAKETGRTRATPTGATATPTGAIATPTLVRATPTGAIATPTVVRATPTGAGATAVPPTGAGATATAVPVNQCVVNRARHILWRGGGVRDPG